MATGDLQSAGRRRAAPDNQRIARRVAKACECHEPAEPSVQPLNPGFFQLEAMRQANVAAAKARKKARAKARGK